MKPEDQKPVGTVEKISSLKWKRLFAKKWFFPAVYLAAAALILSLVWWYQGTRDTGVTKPNTGVGDIELKQEPMPDETEKMKPPLAGNAEAVTTKNYYDEAGSEKSKEASLVEYANTYWPHSGIDYARKDGKTFDIVAAMSGKVQRVEENPLTGYQVEIQHQDGLMTVYQSLSDVKVKKGQEVAQGEPFAKAGRNQFEKETGNHLHFEVRKNGEAVNPETYLKKNN
ncbi:M23 family metallopeptidase [Kroppenstedtia pulmonis]|uniref:M23 family metallopeptidase n=1 Tax=Kroppenstedtia pulmonis TaxID=1380685 RepID=A0A7D3XKJ4_9BACL|nr:M23 family metallopeptidase [Kroppenstedtia pulmonis]QKG85699.1 M23 family metallopeptidase [Kroppenstedtia pulmonis]